MITFVVLFRKSRKTIDTTDTMKTFGPVEIHYGKVQQKVTLKYDSWHKEILSRFGGLLGENMHEFHGTISKVSGTCVQGQKSLIMCNIQM